MSRRPSLWLAFPLSVFIAFLLAALPLPQALAWWRPEFITMVLVFWVLQAPDRIGIWTGFLLGLVVDVLLATPFGVHSLMLAVVAWLARLSWRRVAVFSLLQTSGLVFVLILLGLAVKRLALGVVSTPPDSLLYWLPALTSALVWPTLMLVLRRHVRR
ncbi:MAG: rod shape-determining protein MreD [Moraxellaceae bacterium]